MSNGIVRFGRRTRIEHVAVMVLFTVLAVTGMPQKFYPAGWAVTMVDLMGGIDGVRWIHRAAGFLFGGLLAAHVAGAIAGLWRGRWLPLVPTWQDFRDAVATLRRQLGLEAPAPRFDRYDYRQKFEYWGLLLGGTVMVATGLVLYAPTLVARVVSGQLIPASKVAHSNEGLMALLVVVTWHIFNAHLSPEAFPGDTSIFTGRLAADRMAHEHPLEWERLRSGRPEPAFREPRMVALALAPIRGALLVMFLPMAGFVILGLALVRRRRALPARRRPEVAKAESPGSAR